MHIWRLLMAAGPPAPRTRLRAAGMSEKRTESHSRLMTSSAAPPGPRPFHMPPPRELSSLLLPAHDFFCCSSRPFHMPTGTMWCGGVCVICESYGVGKGYSLTTNDPANDSPFFEKPGWDSSSSCRGHRHECFWPICPAVTAHDSVTAHRTLLRKTPHLP